nr:hypothetical protein [Corynebacterium amycolatum]
MSRLRYPLRQESLDLVEWVEVLLATLAYGCEFAACFPLADGVGGDAEGGCEFGGGLCGWVFDCGVEGFFEEACVVDGFLHGAGSLDSGLHVPPHLTVCPHAPRQVLPLITEPPGHALHGWYGLAVQSPGVGPHLPAGGPQYLLDGEFEVEPGHGAGWFGAGQAGGFVCVGVVTLGWFQLGIEQRGQPADCIEGLQVFIGEHLFQCCLYLPC